MSRRGKVKRVLGHYAQRDAQGQFVEWTSIPRGIQVDARKKVPQKTTESGHGYQQDYYPKFRTKGRGKGRRVYPVK